MDGECPHGMPTKKSCVDCLMDEGVGRDPEETPRRWPLLAVSRSFPARYGGQCPGCNTGIHVGEKVARIEGGGVAHEKCVDR